MQPSDNQHKAIIVFGTASGNAELVSDAIAEGLTDSGIETTVIRGERANVDQVVTYGLIVLISSTYNVGKLQEYYEPFFQEFVRRSLPGKKMAVIGLGDSRYYDIFCGAADVLEEGVKKVGGTLLCPTLRIDGPPHARLDEFKDWGINLANVYRSNNA